MNLKSVHLKSSFWYVLLGFYFATCSASLSAQEDPWYQIEVIIFENRGYNSYGPDPEAWPRNITLAYPAHSQALLSAEELKALEEEEARIQAQQRTAGAKAPFNVEKPFIDLSSELFQLKREYSAVRNERNLRVIFHKVWRQPVNSRENTPAVIIKGGNQYDDHYELEGSLQISVSRYLHLDADIWLTNFEANIGQEDSWWPALPATPKFSENTDAFSDINLQNEQAITTSPPPWQNKDKNSNIRFGEQSYLDDGSDDIKSHKNYVTKEIVKMEQSRRMRSGELHYLDHPKMGLLIRIDNYKKASDSETPATGAE